MLAAARGAFLQIHCLQILCCLCRRAGRQGKLSALLVVQGLLLPKDFLSQHWRGQTIHRNQCRALLMGDGWHDGSLLAAR